MNRLSAMVIACFLAVSIVSAQGTKDPKAQQILKSTSAKYKSLKSMSATFKVTSLDQKTNKKDVQNGSLILKGEKYKLALKGQEVISDGKTSWTYLKESNEVQINDVNSKSDAINPTNIFTIYEKGFSTKYMGDKKVDNVMVHQIELVPDDQKKSFFKIQINIHKSEKIVTLAKIFDKNGNIYIYSIEKFKINIDVDDALFTFDPVKFPGVEVVDLR
ncbi:MAG TPA: outer membrane lipoprotein carrier protein LolA [Bacteroidia bacterium]|nr:outer membrane lipoprotein carrier protein LolA [Bacteroidia bacterium]